jgi:hypothetical protein
MTSDRLIFLVPLVEAYMWYLFCTSSQGITVNEKNIKSKDQRLQLEQTAFVVY